MPITPLSESDNSQILDLLHRALLTPCGIVLRTAQPGAAILRIRKMIERDGFALRAAVSPMMSNEIWIARQEAPKA